MIARILTAAALTTVAATSAQAQTYAFKQSSYSGYNQTYGKFTSSNGPAGAGFAQNSAFQIWCVDQNHNARTSDYMAFATNLGTGDMDNTRLGQAGSNSTAKITYTKAAYLANSMGSGDVNNKQYAIWAMIHGKSAGNYCTGLGSCSSSTVGNLITSAGANYGQINQSEWYVITDASGYGTSNGGQEFIARCQTAGAACDGFTPPNAETPTPEPATMSLIAMGLAGMAGNTLRRRKK